VLLIGAVLVPGKRSVSAALEVIGLSDEDHFQNYRRVTASRYFSNSLLRAHVR
jgi:hypothetical protein